MKFRQNQISSGLRVQGFISSNKKEIRKDPFEIVVLVLINFLYSEHLVLINFASYQSIDSICISMTITVLNINKYK